MSPVYDLPRQVKVECDVGGEDCYGVCDGDEVDAYHFNRDNLAAELTDHDWKLTDDGRVVCPACGGRGE